MDQDDGPVRWGPTRRRWYDSPWFYGLTFVGAVLVCLVVVVLVARAVQQSTLWS